MAKYSNNQIEQIKSLAALFFTPKEIAMMLEYDEAVFCSDCLIEGNDAYKAFMGGRLQAEVDLRTGILKMAKAGSSPAQTMAMDLLKQSTVKLMNR